MSKISICVSDNAVTVDGRGLSIPCDSIRPEISAVQWYGKRGHIEFHEDADGNHVLNENIESLDEFANVIAAFHAKAAEIDAQPKPEKKLFGVSASQAKLALFNAGLLDEVEALISQAEYQPIRIYFENTPYWEVDHPYVHAVAAELGLTDQQMTDMFAAAAKL